MNLFIEVMLSKVKETLSKQVINQGDYLDDKDILICGTCGEPRQEFITKNFSEVDVVTFKTTRMCRCDREKEEELKRQKLLEDRQNMINVLKEASLMDARFHNATFENYTVTDYNARNHKLCLRYASRFDEMLKKSQGLLLWGGVGTGKSFSAACIANYLLDRQISVAMTSFVKILELIQKDRNEEPRLIEKLSSAKLLILDDFGAERNTDYALEKVYNVIDSRYRSKLPMIITTNLSLPDMKRETDIRYTRLYDRIFEVCYPMQFTGKSFRIIEAADRFNEMAEFLEGND